MCDIQEEICTEQKCTLPQKFQLSIAIKEKLTEFPEVLEFIYKLQKYLEQQNRKLQTLRRKYKEKASLIDVACQTESLEETGKVNICNEIKEAAEQAVQRSGFVFEETSGMYYDYNSGYYYNAELGLYYDGNNGTYLRYNPESQTYQIHSVIKNNEDCLGSSAGDILKRESSSQDEAQAAKRKYHDNEDAESLELGECTDDDDDEPIDQYHNVLEMDYLDLNDLSTSWPPCMRIIVAESSTPNMKVGSLHIVTYEGGTIGREGNHSILLEDLNVSKYHLKIVYNKDLNKYFAIDLGSRNGTILNGKRMSSSKQESQPIEIVHGSNVQIGSTTLLCHIHSGNQTCGQCEPGLIQVTDEKVANISTKNWKNNQHRKELKQLKKKFGIKQLNSEQTNILPGYVDRAQARRETIGSINHHEKTEIASTDEFISSTNKGFKLLCKMGWSEGQSLGKGEGLLEPINVITESKSTLFSGSVIPKRNQNNATKDQILVKTLERYNNTNVLSESNIIDSD